MVLNVLEQRLKVDKLFILFQLLFLLMQKKEVIIKMVP
jgi:hypothetical protein